MESRFRLQIAKQWANSRDQQEFCLDHSDIFIRATGVKEQVSVVLDHAFDENDVGHLALLFPIELGSEDGRVRVIEESELLNADAPAQCAREIREALSESCAKHPLPSVPMVSRADHDSLFSVARRPGMWIGPGILAAVLAAEQYLMPEQKRSQPGCSSLHRSQQRLIEAHEKFRFSRTKLWSDW